MQAIADAIMALGRSLNDIRGNLWLCGALASDGNDGPKCANGLVTMHLGYVKRQVYGNVVYEYNYGYLHELTDNREAARLAGVALVQAAQDNPALFAGALKRAEGAKPASLDALELPTAASLESLGDAVALINDVGYDEDTYGEEGGIDTGMGTEGAAKWFSAAIDKLAAQLPEPLPVEPPLTVEQIIAAARPEHQLV